jgi:hypothetical protein
MSRFDDICQSEISLQTCRLCSAPISNQRYHRDPETDGYVHSLCLALETHLVMTPERIWPDAD